MLLEMGSVRADYLRHLREGVDGIVDEARP
jgi:hypothetical protein